MSATAKTSSVETTATVVNDSSSHLEEAAPSPRPRQPTRVRFMSRTEVYLVLALSEYTKQEMDAVYRGKKDERLNQTDIITTIQLARKNNGSVPSEQGVDMTERGIEILCSISLIMRSKSRKEGVIDVVLDEADRQFEDTGYMSNPDEIAGLSMQSSQESMDEAITRGAEDAAYVQTHVRQEAEVQRLLQRVQRAVREDLTSANAPSSNDGKILSREALVADLLSIAASMSDLPTRPSSAPPRIRRCSITPSTANLQQEIGETGIVAAGQQALRASSVNW